jgi:hypothetical protein
MENEIYLGVIYKNDKAQNYYEKLAYRKGLKTTPAEEVKPYSINKLMEEFS